MVEVVMTVGKPTGVIETTPANLDPVLAQLGLVSRILAFVVVVFVGLSLLLLLLDEGLLLLGHSRVVEVLWQRHENVRVIGL